MPPFATKRVFSIITVSGFSAAVAQIVLLRELMVLCYGIELCVGVILAVWLLWSALGCGPCARLANRYFPDTISPEYVLIIAAIVLPLTLLVIRASGILWGIVPGEIPPLVKLLQISLGATFLFSLLSGLLFGLCCNLAKKNAAPPLTIFTGEALGATAGGILFYLLILCGQSTLTIVLVTSGAMLLVATWSKGTARKNGSRLRTCFLPMMIVLAIAAGFRFGGTLDQASRKMQWGRDIVAGKDTAYQNLIMLRKNGQTSIYANGLWLFSVPDPSSREYAVHPILLQHPAPESVLLLGGGPAGLSAEILRHPSVRHIDIVEPDQDLTVFLKKYLKNDFAGSDIKHKVTWYYQDAIGFLHTPGLRYDVVLMSMGDPINAQMNRFYTTAFFSAVKNRVSQDGIFSFGVSGSSDMLGEVQIQFLGIIYRTLSHLFPNVSVLPGDQVRFVATKERTMSVEDPNLLIGRLRQRNLHLSHVREDTIRDIFEGFRMQYFKSVLQDSPMDQINSDHTPLCYAYALELWMARWHSRLGGIVASVTRIPPRMLFSFFPLVCLLAWAVYKLGRFDTAAAITLSTATVGSLTMVFQMVLLIEFQIISGALFLHLALIVALFMAGLASGTGWASLETSPCSGIVHAKSRLLRVQAMICLFPLVMMGLFFLIQTPPRSAASSAAPVILFAFLSLLSGFMGGLHFSAATRTMVELGHPAGGIGGKLYAFDLVGAAGGLLVATFVLIPSIGPLRLLPLLSIASGTSLAMLCLKRH